MGENSIPNFEGQIVQLSGAQLQALVMHLNNIYQEIENIKHEMINLHYPSPYFTRKEAMDYLRVGRKKFWEMESNGEITIYYIGNTTSAKMKRYKREELDRLLNRQSVYTINI